MHQSFDREGLLHWYDANARELPWRVSPARRKAGEQPDPYRVWLSEVMLQQTTVSVVRDYFLRFCAHWPTVHELAAASREDVLKEWAGLGYYARARNLHACARKIVADFAGGFPQSARKLADLPGIGPYTSAAIAAICYDERIAVVDANVERVISRFLALEKPLNESRPEIRKSVQSLVPERAGDFAQSLMDLGATICRPRGADCDICPLARGCVGRTIPDPARLPLKQKKKARPIRYGHAFVLQRGDNMIWLCKRPDKGLLASMTGVPVSPWESQFAEVDFPMAGNWMKAGCVAHVFTHFRLELEVWKLRGVDIDPTLPGWWVPAGDLAEEALPGVFRKVLATAGFE